MGGAEFTDEANQLGAFGEGEDAHTEFDGVYGGGSFFGDSSTVVGKFTEDGAPVVGVGYSGYEALGFEAVDDIGDASGVDHKPLTHLAHWERSSAAKRQQGERFVAGESEVERN